MTTATRTYTSRKEGATSVPDNKELLRSAAKAFNNIDDRYGWYDFHDERVKAHGLAPGALDLAGLKTFYAALWGGFPDLTINIDELVGEGDKVVWRISVSGTHDGPFFGLPASRKVVKFGAHYTFRFEHGRIVEHWSTLDRLSLLAQVGAVTLPSST